MPESPTIVNDLFNLPTTLPVGNYQLLLVITDSNGSRKPLPISIEGRNIDGAYPLTLITIPQNAPTPNQHPKANAGIDQVISLPQQTALLDGTKSTDPDGTIVAYHWKIISGMEGAQILQPDAAKTIIDHLSPGNYTIELTVTDNLLASATTQVHFIVHSSTPTTLNGSTNKIYPNPAHNQLNVNIFHGATGLINCTVFNAIGTMIMMVSGQKSTHNYSTIINTSTLPNGSYILKIQIGHSDTITQKFIKI
jgi:hypothetical protein